MALPALSANNYYVIPTRYASGRAGIGRKRLIDLAIRQDATSWLLADPVYVIVAVRSGGFILIVHKTYRRAPDGKKLCAFIIDAMPEDDYDPRGHNFAGLIP